MHIYSFREEEIYMKKIKLSLLITMVSLINFNVKALVPNIIYQSNIYGNKVNGSRIFYGKLGYIYLNGRIAYCLEPYKLVGTDYVVDDSVRNKFNQSDIDYFKLLSYYGYNHSNHNNVYYYMATQELIWRHITNQEVYWTTENVAKGERINIENYKAEILNSINNHNKVPSFKNAEVKGKFRETIVLEDTNNVLNYYEINNKTLNKVKKDNNKLYITLMSSKNESITLERKYNDGGATLFYSALDNQALGTFSLNEIKRINISMQATNKYSMKLNVIFKNVNNNKIIKDKIKFKIKNIDNNTYLNDTIYETNNGIYNSDFYVEEGNYQIEPIDFPSNYINYENTKFQIVEDPTKEEISVESYLDEAIGRIELKRIFDMTKIGKEKIEVANAEYELRAKDDIFASDGELLYKKDELVSTIKTNENGKGNIDKIPIGNYYVKEISEDDIITKNDEIHDIEIKYKDKNTKEIIEKLEIITIPKTFDWNLDIEERTTKCVDDECEKKTRKLEDIKYGIYAEEDISVDDNTIKKSGDLITKIKTNKEGKIDETIPLLPGKYVIKEETDMSKYPEKYENVEFAFDEQKEIDMKIIKTLNKKETKFHILPKTSDKYFKYYFSSIVAFILGLGLIFYEKKD